MPRPFPPPSFLPGPDVHSLAALLVRAIAPDYLAGSDINELVATARRHGVAPMLYWHLKQVGLNLKTPEWHDLWFAHQKQVRAYLEHKLAFTRLDATFRSANIPTVWLKGFALAHSVYPNPALRPMRDIDVLVPAAQKEHALELAQQLGYVLDMPPHSEAMQSMWHHYHLRGDIALELHYSLIGLRSKLLTPEQLDWFWAHTRVLQANDLTFTCFTPEAELLYLCAHAILQHGETEFLLHRYLDLHLLIQKNPALDWNSILEQAIDARWTYAVQRALEITREYFGTTIPDETLQELQTRRPPEEASFIGFEILPDSTRLQVTSTLMRAMSPAEKWKWFWGSLLPTPAWMRWRYQPRATWQLPFFYLYRWFVIARDVIQTMLKWAKSNS